MPAKLLFVLSFLVLPLPALAQDVPPPVADPDDPPPGMLAYHEEERSRACVRGHALLATVENALEPLAQRSARLRQLGDAMGLEDISRAEPFNEDDPIELGVRAWFSRDAEYARQYADTQDEAILQERRNDRAAMYDRLANALNEVSEEAQLIIQTIGGVEEAVERCDGKILVREPVLEACRQIQSPVCEAARSSEPVRPYRFVEDAEDLWGIERVRPWAAPQRLRPVGGEGSLGGGSTEVTLEKGNLTVNVALETLIRPRSELPAEEIAEFMALLDRLDWAFGHPEFVMAPVISFELELPAPLAGENGYILHFGNDAEGALHSVSARQEGSVGASFVATPEVLERLQTGEQLTVSAIGIAVTDDGAPEMTVLYAFELNSVRQSESVAELITYWAGGGLSDDLLDLIPPGDR